MLRVGIRTLNVVGHSKVDVGSFKEVAFFSEVGRLVVNFFGNVVFDDVIVVIGVDISLIARQVGHSSTRMVEEVYSHYTDKARSRFETKLANIEIDI